MAKVRPLSMRELLKFIRGRPYPTRNGHGVRDLYIVTELELKALASAFYRASRKKPPRPDRTTDQASSNPQEAIKELRRIEERARLLMVKAYEGRHVDRMDLNDLHFSIEQALSRLSANATGKDA